MTINWLAVTGLGLDILGASILVRAIILNPDRRIAQSTAAAFGVNWFLTAAFIEQKVESRVGLAVLVLGFSLQLLATLNLNVGPEMAAILAIAVGTTVVCFFLFLKERLVINKTVSAVRDVVKANDPVHADNHRKLRADLKRYLRENKVPEA